MRITGGKARGICLKTPSTNGTRPATDRLRQSIFSSLGHNILNVHVLDVFAGTGAYALEALSRGALNATCIELAKEPILCIKKNAEAVLKSAELSSESLDIIKADALTWTPEANIRFEIIFIDPPYPIWPAVASQLLPKIADWALPATHIFMEHPGEALPQIPQNWVFHKTFGKGKQAPCASLFSISF